MTLQQSSPASFAPALTPEEGVEQATALFREAFDAEPDGVWYAPGRVNIIGEHTDYNGGLALPIALPHRAYLALRRREDRVVRLISPQTRDSVDVMDLDTIGPKGTPGEVRRWASYIAGVAWALERDGFTDLPGFDAALVSCVPLGGGLSSSAALECAAAVAIDEVAGLGLAGGVDSPDDEGRSRLVQVCVRTENEMAGAPTGGMDQSASLRCLPGHALELDCRDGSVTHVPFDLAAQGLALLVIDTKAKHSLVDGQYGARRAACERAAELLGVDLLADVSPDALGEALDRLRAADQPGAGATEAAALPRRPSQTSQPAGPSQTSQPAGPSQTSQPAGPSQTSAQDAAQTAQVLSPEILVRRTRHVVTEIARTRQLVELLQDGEPLTGERLAAVGTLMDASHESLRVDYECTCPELDTAVEAARAAGAHGARMTGGGFGGSAIALVDADAVQEVAEAVTRAYAQAGFNPPAFLDAVPSAPAGRLA